MSFVLIICLAFLCLASVVIGSRKVDKLKGFIVLLAFVTVALMLKESGALEDQSLFFGLIGIVSINFIVSRFSFAKKWLIQLIVPLVSLGGYFYFFQHSTITFLDEEYSIFNKFLISGTLISLLAIHVFRIKHIALTKFSVNISEKETIQMGLVFFGGLALFLGDFGASSFGILVITTALISSLFYKNGAVLHVVIGLLLFTSLKHFSSLGDISTINILNGDVLLGIFLGVFSSFLIHKVWDIKNKRTLFLIVSYLIVIGLNMLFIYSETQNANMGGMDTFVGSLIGVGLTQLLIGGVYQGVSIMSLLMIIGMIMPATLVNEELKAFEEAQEVKEDEGTNEKETVLNLADVAGDYEINPDKSSVSFELGKEGETKGAFKKIAGSFTLSENLESCNFKIELSMDDFTTFNSYRDGSLMGEDYFKMDQYPSMNFQGNKMVELEDGSYELNGKFTMLGVRKEVNVSLELKMTDGDFTITGSGEIDRTLFGMVPSATEGNVVSFNYKAVLN